VFLTVSLLFSSDIWISDSSGRYSFLTFVWFTLIVTVEPAQMEYLVVPHSMVRLLGSVI